MADVARPTLRQALAEIRDVAHDVPAFLTAPLYRSRHLRWGATPAENAGAPGPDPSDRTAFKVGSFAVNEWLLWSKPDSTWAWRLTSAGPGQTRLVTRIRAAYDWQRPLMAFFGMLLMEFGDFAMLRRMLRGIKARAEALAREGGRPT